MLNAKKGLSACQVARDIGVRRTTVWEVMRKIRKAFATEQKELLRGIFEMDETYIKTNKSNTKKDDNDDENGSSGSFGDFDDEVTVVENNNKGNATPMILHNFGDGSKTIRDKFACGRSTKNNTPVVGIKQKNGLLKAFVTRDTKYSTLGKIAMETAEVGSEFHTDEYSSYKMFKAFFTHKMVNHSIEYVNRDGVHCNSVEGFWGIFKRGLKGQFHHVSTKYLQRYINEFVYRYNNRFIDENMVFNGVVERMLKI